MKPRRNPKQNRKSSNVAERWGRWDSTVLGWTLVREMDHLPSQRPAVMGKRKARTTTSQGKGEASGFTQRAQTPAPGPWGCSHRHAFLPYQDSGIPQQEQAAFHNHVRIPQSFWCITQSFCRHVPQSPGDAV